MLTKSEQLKKKMNSVEQDLTEFSLEDRAEIFDDDAPESSIMEFEDIYAK